MIYCCPMRMNFYHLLRQLCPNAQRSPTINLSPNLKSLFCNWKRIRRSRRCSSSFVNCSSPIRNIKFHRSPRTSLFHWWLVFSSSELLVNTLSFGFSNACDFHLHPGMNEKRRGYWMFFFPILTAVSIC